MQYEQAEDRVNEKVTAEAFALEFGLAPYKLKTFNEIDYALFDGDDLRCFAEVKCRKNRMRDFPSLMLSLHKWIALKRYDEYAKAGSLIVVRWTDVPLACFFVRDYRKTPPVRWCEGRGGREGEPVILLPINAFVKLR